MLPKALIFDEPTANLDPAGTREFFAALEVLKKTGEYTIVLIEHKLDALMHLVDRVVVLEAGGHLLADGLPREVFRDRAPELVARGVWMPQVSLLAHRLGQRGTRLEPFPVTVEEAERGLGGVFPGPPASDNLYRLDGHRPPSPASVLLRPASEEAAAIEVRNLSFSYGERRVLDGVSLSVPSGDFLAIVGANGAGKTTLARHLMGLIAPPRGSVFVGGGDVARLAARDLICRAGFVFQNPDHQFVTDSVEREVSFGLRLLGLSEDEAASRTGAMLERFGLDRYAAANPFTLSHGEKRRLSVATMLAVGQEVLILDEPTFGQDQKNAAGLMGLLDDLNTEGRTVVVITHDMSLVAEHARNVAVLVEGRLLFHGPVPGLFARPELLEEARLELPPLAALSRALAKGGAGRDDLLTLRDFLGASLPNTSGEEASRD